MFALTKHYTARRDHCISSVAVSQRPPGQYYSPREAEREVFKYICVEARLSPPAAEMLGVANGVSLHYICVLVCEGLPG